MISIFVQTSSSVVTLKNGVRARMFLQVWTNIVGCNTVKHIDNFILISLEILFCSEEAKRLWMKHEEKWLQEQAARNNLMRDVLDTLSMQAS